MSEPNYVTIIPSKKKSPIVTSQHRCYKGAWYYKAKARVKALKASLKAAEAFDETGAFNEGVNAAAELLAGANRPKSASIARGALKVF